MTNRRAHLHQTVRTVSLGTLWRILRYPFVLLTLIFVPRLMGDAVYGQFAYFLSLFVILDVVTDVGIVQIFGRFIPELTAGRSSEKSRTLLHGVLVYGSLLTLIPMVALAGWALIQPLAELPPHRLAILCLLLLLNRIEGILYAFLYGLNQIARFSFKEGLRTAVTLGLVLLFYRGFGLDGALWALVVNEAILLVLAARWTRAFLFPRWGRIPMAFMRPYIIFGIQFFIPAGLFGLLQRTGNVLIQGLTHSSPTVAYFDVANQFLLLASGFLGLLLATLVPALTTLHLQQEQTTIQRWLKIVMTYCGIITFLTINTLMWLGRTVIVRVLGPAFAPVFPAAAVMALGLVPMLIIYMGVNYAILEKKSAVYTGSMAAGLAVMLLASVWWIPGHGSLGAAWAAVLGYVAAALVFFWYYRRVMLAVLGEFWMVLLIGVGFSAFYSWPFGPWGMVLGWVGTSALYLAVMALLRLVRPADLRKLRQAFQT